MSLSKSLQKEANRIRNQSPEIIAIDMLKQAGLSEDDARVQYAQYEMEKAAYSQLTQSGIDYDRAVELVKVAGIKVEKSDVGKSQDEIWAEFLEKNASEAKSLEVENQKLLEKIAALEAALDQVPEAYNRTPDTITKFASTGNFTNDDLAALMSLPSELLTKVAHTNEGPRRIGGPGGRTNTPMTASDTFAALLLGDN